MHKLFLTIALFCCCIQKTHAQDKRYEYADSSLLDGSQSPEDDGTGSYENTATNEVTDILSDTTLYIGKINISPDSITNFKNDKRFAYIRNLDSLLKEKPDKHLDNKTSDGGSNSFLFWLLTSPAIRIIFWVIAASFVGFILYRLFLSNGIFRRNTLSSTATAMLEEDQAVTLSDYDRLILQAYNTGDYRLAVRYLFLKNLAHLSEKEYLQLSANKTNFQYVQEISADKKNEFSSLLLIYEYIWYGNFLLNRETYTGIEKKYSSFYHKI